MKQVLPRLFKPLKPHGNGAEDVAQEVAAAAAAVEFAVVMVDEEEALPSRTINELDLRPITARSGASGAHGRYSTLRGRFARLPGCGGGGREAAGMVSAITTAASKSWSYT